MELDSDGNVIQTESIKLNHNTKGYTWEIKIREINIDRVYDLDQQMMKKFGVPGSSE